jgi:hypothetical protein
MATAHGLIDEWKARSTRDCLRSSQSGSPEPRVHRGTRDRSHLIEEPDEVKVSRPVLKPGGGGDPAAQVNV